MSTTLTQQPDVTSLKALGSKTAIPDSPSIDILETFRPPTTAYFTVTFTQSGEFTSNCPLTGQPDYGDIRLLYRPLERCVESKALKLYLASYRNTGSFGETIVNQIADHLQQVLSPVFLVVIGDFKPRGGIGWKPKAIRFHENYKAVDLADKKLDFQAISNFQ